jgi:hypothetical protein
MYDLPGFDKAGNDTGYAAAAVPENNPRKDDVGMGLIISPG